MRLEAPEAEELTEKEERELQQSLDDDERRNRSAEITVMQSSLNKTLAIIAIQVPQECELSPYELDHLGGVVSHYLIQIGFQSASGLGTFRPELTDEQHNAENFDFSVEWHQEARLRVRRIEMDARTATPQD